MNEAMPAIEEKREINAVENKEPALKKLNELQTKEDIIAYVDGGVTSEMSSRQARDHVYSTILSISRSKDWELYPGDTENNGNNPEIAVESAEKVRGIARELFKNFNGTKFAKLSEMSEMSEILVAQEDAATKWKKNNPDWEEHFSEESGEKKSKRGIRALIERRRFKKFIEKEEEAAIARGDMMEDDTSIIE